MNEFLVNIWKRCEGTCTCRKVNKGRISAEAGVVGSSDFGYCTHAVSGGNIIKKATWKGQELDRIGFLHELEDVESITTYYHTTYDGKQDRINNPLLIRTKYGNKTCWYENAGHYANKKWRRIRSEEPGGFPEDDSNYLSDGKFVEKLKNLACTLCGLHGVYLDETDGYHDRCEVCYNKIFVNFSKQQNIVPGYYQHKYDNIPNTSVLVHKGTKLTHRKGSFYWNSYYLLIKLYGKIQSVLVYYWDGDYKRDNPLLIEVKYASAGTDWYENVSRDKKGEQWIHEKWKPLSYRGNVLPDLKERLDALSCIYNGTVQIKFGEVGCHSPGYATLHETRIKSSYTQVIHDPLIYTRIYEPTGEFDGTTFNVSEIFMEGLQQKLNNDTLNFTKIKKLTAYVSHCDNNKPFLIYVENENNVHKWYERKDEKGNWEVYDDFTESPDKVTTKIEQAFSIIKPRLGIKKCLNTSAIIQLDITKMPNPGSNTIVYDSNGTSIIVTRTENNPVDGFFRNFHESTKTSFTLKPDLGRGHELRGVLKPGLKDVKDAYAYFWDGDINYEKPLIVEVQETSKKPRYYSKGNSPRDSWLYEGNKDKELVPLLDHKNCQLNGVIPIDLKNPADLSKFYPYTSQRCIGTTRNVKSKSTGTSLFKDSDYVVNSYSVTPLGTKISRVTYDGPNNSIFVLNKEVSDIQTYTWNGNPIIPLLVEFTGKSEKLWYENLGDPQHMKWKRVPKMESDKFYEGDGPQPSLTEKLDEVNCNVNSVIQLDISQPGKYCHKHKYKVEVSPTSKENKIDGLDGYEHAPIDGFYFNITSLKNGTIKQVLFQSASRQHKGDFLKVKKAIIYFSACDYNNNIPILIYIEYNYGGKQTWFRRADGTHPKVWTEAEKLKNLTPGKAKANDAFNGVVRSIGNNLNIPCLKALKRRKVIKVKRKKRTLHIGTKPDSDDEDEKLTSENLIGDVLDYKGEKKEFLRDEEKEDKVIKEVQAEYTLLRPNSTTFIVPPITQHSDSTGYSHTEPEEDDNSDEGSSSVELTPNSTPPGVPSSQSGPHTALTTQQELSANSSGKDNADSNGPDPKVTPLPEGTIAAKQQSQRSLTEPAPSARRAPSPNPGSPTNHPPYVITSSVLTASGSLTGFAYWIYQRFNGEPWVRQI